MSRSTVLFMGSAPFSLEILQELCALPVTVSAVYTQCPKPAGRGRNLQKNPVHCWAEEQGIPVQTPTNLRALSEQAFPCDALIVAAYGLILPAALLALPRYGGINVHASLLPRWRGAAPAQQAVLAGDKETGITLMRMDSGLDTGPILATQRVPILPDMTTGELLVALAQAGRELIRRELLPLSCLIERARPQPTEGATYAPKISPKEGALQWTQTPLQLERRVRAFAPTPGAWFWCEGKRIKVFRASPLEGVPTQAPGTMLDAQCTIACAEGALRLLEIQPEGKGRMLGTEFLRGHPHLVGRKV